MKKKLPKIRGRKKKNAETKNKTRAAAAYDARQPKIRNLLGISTHL